MGRFSFAHIDLPGHSKTVLDIDSIRNAQVPSTPSFSTPDSNADSVNLLSGDLGASVPQVLVEVSVKVITIRDSRKGQAGVLLPPDPILSDPRCAFRALINRNISCTAEGCIAVHREHDNVAARSSPCCACGDGFGNNRGYFIGAGNHQ